jgi:SAM-dependent methyltransferase
MASSTTSRFSDRVADYVASRPGYPEPLFQTLQHRYGLSAGQKVADIGSGTGISTQPFLQLGCQVFAVEPNAEMRAAAEAQFANLPTFHSISGSAEKTNLSEASVDFIVAAQAFHWFANDTTRQEFSRILKPDGLVILVWNERQTHSTPFLRDYEALLMDLASDYREVRHENIDSSVLERFFRGPYETHSFAHEQLFDLEGLKSRARSCSYVPAQDHPGHPPFMTALEEVFARHEASGRVAFAYQTKMHLGQ